MINRYSTEEMLEIWSEQSKFQAWLDVEIAACEAWAEVGKIPAEDLKTIKDKAKFSVNRIEELDRQLHHDVIAFTTCLAENIGPSSRFVHLGLTSTDVVDTAQSLRLRRVKETIISELNILIDTVKQAALEHKDTIMIGRTHGVHGEPITLGLKFLVYYQELKRNLARVSAGFDDVIVGKISGAVGTHAHTGPDFESRICKNLNLPVAEAATQVLQRDRHAAFVSSLAVLAGTIDKIAVEIRHLQKTETRELEEPFAKGQKGSSAMPHKRNPVKCEQLSGLSRLIRGYALAAMENQPLWHERDISHSSAERVLLSDSTTLIHYMVRLLNKVLSGLHIYPDTMKENMEKTRGLLFSQKIMLAVVEKGVSREDAYALVQNAAMDTWANKNTTLKSELLKEEKFPLSEAELDGIMDPKQYLIYVTDIYKRCGL